MSIIYIQTQIDNAIAITEHMKKEIEKENYEYALVLNKTIVYLLDTIIKNKKG